MLVPGPHLINSAHDMLENHMQTAVCRLGLAVGLLTAAALGVVLGGWLILGPATISTSPSDAMRLTLPLDVALAGVAACGFGAFYNAPWRVLWVSVLCGIVGHGVRYLCLDHLSMGISTLFACLAIGLIANVAANRLHLPFSAVAFAGTVPMMPGVLVYQSLAGAMRLLGMVGGRSRARRRDGGALGQGRARGGRHGDRPSGRCPARRPGPRHG